MKYKEFNEVNEQSILDNCPKVIGDIKKEFGILLDEVNDSKVNDDSSSFGETRGYSRVLTKDNSNYFSKDNIDSNIDENSYVNDFSIDGDIRKSNGASYVLIVAALIALIIIVYVVTTTILGMVDIDIVGY